MLRRGDPPPADRATYMAEAHATYAAGLLAVALTADHIADDGVRSGAVAPLARYLRRSVTRGCAAAPAAMPDREVRGAHGGRYPCTNGAASVYGAAEAASPSDGRTAAEVPLIRAGVDAAVLCAYADGDEHDAPQAATLGSSEELGGGPEHSEQEVGTLRERREMFALRGVACLAEYLESVAPLMQARLGSAHRHWHSALAQRLAAPRPVQHQTWVNERDCAKPATKYRLLFPAVALPLFHHAHNTHASSIIVAIRSSTAGTDRGGHSHAAVPLARRQRPPRGAAAHRMCAAGASALCGGVCGRRRPASAAGAAAEPSHCRRAPCPRCLRGSAKKSVIAAIKS